MSIDLLMSITQQVDFKLITILIVASLAIGVIIGLILKEAAKLKARRDPETYQFFEKRDYVSIAFDKYSPDFIFSFLSSKTIALLLSNEIWKQSSPKHFTIS